MSHASIPSANVHPMDGGRADRDGAARDYEKVLPARIDVLLLGMGPDGHTASLFPGSPALNETERRVVAVTAPKPPAERLTITPPVIAAAINVVVLVTGAEKAGMVAKVLDGAATPAELPVWLARGGTWILDAPAASGLKDGGRGRKALDKTIGA
jgi:6-phosphogluconolactonase